MATIHTISDNTGDNKSAGQRAGGTAKNKEVSHMRVLQGQSQDHDNSTGRCLAFAEAARQLRISRQELLMPSFRSPPRQPGWRRSLSRHTDGSVTVSVMIKNRPWSAVLSDMVEGVIATNSLEGPTADAARDQLWEALDTKTPQHDAA